MESSQNVWKERAELRDRIPSPSFSFSLWETWNGRTHTHPLLCPNPSHAKASPVTERLIETLDELHQQLQDPEKLDEEDRRKLREAVEEIRESLDQDDIDSGGLAKAFHQITEQFSEAHPRLTETAGRFADLLAQMGI